MVRRLAALAALVTGIVLAAMGVWPVPAYAECGNGVPMVPQLATPWTIVNTVPDRNSTSYVSDGSYDYYYGETSSHYEETCQWSTEAPAEDLGVGDAEPPVRYPGDYIRSGYGRPPICGPSACYLARGNWILVYDNPGQYHWIFWLDSDQRMRDPAQPPPPTVTPVPTQAPQPVSCVKHQLNVDTPVINIFPVPWPHQVVFQDTWLRYSSSGRSLADVGTGIDPNEMLNSCEFRGDLPGWAPLTWHNSGSEEWVGRQIKDAQLHVSIGPLGTGRTGADTRFWWLWDWDGDAGRESTVAFDNPDPAHQYTQTSLYGRTNYNGEPAFQPSLLTHWQATSWWATWWTYDKWCSSTQQVDDLDHDDYIDTNGDGVWDEVRHVDEPPHDHCSGYSEGWRQHGAGGRAINLLDRNVLAGVNLPANASLDVWGYIQRYFYTSEVVLQSVPVQAPR